MLTKFKIFFTVVLAVFRTMTFVKDIGFEKTQIETDNDIQTLFISYGANLFKCDNNLHMN